MQGWTPLHCAAQGGHAEIVDLLLSSGAHAGAQDAEVCSKACLLHMYCMFFTPTIDVAYTL